MRPTIFIASAAFLALTACGGYSSTTTLPDTNTNGGQTGDVVAQLDAPFTLAPGQWGAIAGTALRVGFTGVTSDSRCPSNVQCVWEGDAAVALRASLSGTETPVTLHTSGAADAATTAHVGGYVLSIADVQPAPVAGQTIAANAYRVKLLVRRK